MGIFAHLLKARYGFDEVTVRPRIAFPNIGARMSTTLEQPTETFTVDRRQPASGETAGLERRQFGNNHFGLSPDARELAEAIDGYKMLHRRRYITFEEMLTVIRNLGYSKA
jgi:hypothetical protein